MSIGAANDVLLDKRVVVVSDHSDSFANIRSALQKCGATVDLVAAIDRALPALIGHDVDLLVLTAEAVQGSGLALLKEAAKLWPWLGVMLVGRRLSPDLKNTFARLKINCLVSDLDDYSTFLRLAREEIVARNPGFRDLETYQFSDFQYQLRILRQVTEPAMRATTFGEALRELTAGLGRWVPASVVAMLGVEEERPSLILQLLEPVAPAFVQEVRKTIVDRYASLTGESLPNPLPVFQEGLEVSVDGVPHIGSSFSVPIVAAGKVDGILLLAAAQPGAYSDHLISFIYHAANHFSTAFAALAQIRKLATRDPMTGLFNRFHLEQEYLAVAKQCRRYHHSMAVVIVDIDHFKAVNDTFGHLVGDEVLREFAQQLRAATRESDIIGRYGGEEFVVLLPRGDRASAQSYAERLAENMRQHVFCAGSFDLRLTISCGVAIGNPLSEEEQVDFPLLVKADTALYEAKKRGRNCTRVWSEEFLPKTASHFLKGDDFQSLAQRRKESSILVVDDEESVRMFLCKALSLEGYKCAVAENGEQAMAILKAAPYAYDLALVDLQMRGMNGFELINRIRAVDDSIMTVVISGHATVDNALQSLRSGAYDFIQKPIMLQQLLAVARRALDYRAAILENRQYQQHLSDMVQQKSARLTESVAQVRLSYEFTLESLVSLLDAREKDFGQHSKRVKNLSILLARKMDLTDDAVEAIAHGALLHDIGKIGVPDGALLKRGALNQQEWEAMKQHPEIGYRILASSPYLSAVAEIVYSHHERFDGNGYPRQLAGSQICLGARIFAVVDAYDAMRSTRTYRSSQTAAAAVAEIKAGSGTQFDPAVVDTFLTCQEEMEELFLGQQG